jgi:ferrous iron transport protein B
MHILLVGNPNCGKTTLFNALTHDNQKVGNWPGVTVEKKTGSFIYENHSITITDLPGIYSLSIQKESGATDEQITASALTSLESDCIVNVVDACHLERGLYLTSQILELGKPVIVVLNMGDLAKKQGITIDSQALSTQLHCPVIPMQAHNGVGMDALYSAFIAQSKSCTPLSLDLNESVTDAINTVKNHEMALGRSAEVAHYLAYRALESGDYTSHASLEMDSLLADARYKAIHQMVMRVQTRASEARDNLTAMIDKVVLHRFLALPIFFSLMYLMFIFAINLGGAFQDFFDISTETIFVKGTATLLQQLYAPDWLIALLAEGVGRGINTTLTFIPVIGCMFFFLSLLETSGYMARAAFVVDKVMRFMGLPGKSFVPMIVGFGCNVPAIMAARTLDSEHDRLLTILMSPFMSCSARLAIYAVFVAAFFPTGGAYVVFSLYLIGILMAVLTGLLVKNTFLKGASSPLILELPAYHRPTLKRLLKETGIRLRVFVFRAGKLIIPVCVILGGLNKLDVTFGGETTSVLALIGKTLTPIFAPMGLTQENWPATVGLLTGMLAKEVVVGSLNALYAQASHLDVLVNQGFDFFGDLQAALYSIPQNLIGLGQAFLNPFSASAPENVVSQSFYGIMVERFDGSAGAFAYLLFILLYIPCVSTMAVIKQEAGRTLMWFSVSWSFFIAYAAAVLCYQLARFSSHPLLSIVWIGGIASLFLLGTIVIYHRNQMGERYALRAG